MASTEDFLKNRRTFVLGAGFSAAAGIPLTNDLLQRALQGFRLSAPGLLKRIEGQAQICFENRKSIEKQDLNAEGFAKLCSYLHFLELGEHAGGQRWCAAGSRELVALRYYIAKYLVKVTPADIDIPKLYLDFAGQLTKNDCIITFNWDTLLENAIEAVGKRFVYSLDGIDLNSASSDDVVLLIKLHGSVNWCLDTTSFRNRAGCSPLDTPSMPDVETVFSCERLRSAIHWDFQPNTFLETQPFIVLPGHGKSHDVRRLSSLWYRPEGYFYVSRDVYLIGLSLSADDYFVRFFMMNSLPLGQWKNLDRRLVIINPSETDMAAGYGFLKSSEASKLLKKFDQKDIEMLRERMSQA